MNAKNIMALSLLSLLSITSLFGGEAKRGNGRIPKVGSDGQASSGSQGVLGTIVQAVLFTGTGMALTQLLYCWDKLPAFLPTSKDKIQSQNQITRLEQQQTALKQQQAALERQLTETGRALTEKDRALTTSTQQATDLEQHLQRIQQILAQTEQNLTEAKAVTIGDLLQRKEKQEREQVVSEYNRKEQELVNKIATTEARTKAAESSLQGAQQQVAMWTQQKRQAEDEINEWQRRAETHQQEIAASNQEVATTQKEIAQLAQQRDAALEAAMRKITRARKAFDDEAETETNKVTANQLAQLEEIELGDLK